MVGLLMLSVIAALGASVFCLVAGYGLLVAVMAYIGTGVLMALGLSAVVVLKRHLHKRPEGLTQSHV